ncbi:MAG: hypothetical protein HFJ12_01730 [Bacilli bacterium]|nr:hypothetical protein [Bacilli bacterium]
MELFQIGAGVKKDNCQGLSSIVRLIKKGLFPIIQLGVPILLIIMGTVDLGKAVISSDEKEVKGAQSRLIKRCIYAVLIFFMVTLVSIVMGLVATSQDENGSKNANSWSRCWNSVE